MAWQSPYESPYPNAGPHSPMNGFKDQNLDEDAFGPAPGNIVSAFDAFRMLPHLLNPKRPLVHWQLT